MKVKNAIKHFFAILILLSSIDAGGQNLDAGVRSHYASLNNPDRVQYLGDLCWELREKSTDSALIYGKKALDLADSLEYYGEYARISNFVGVIYMHYLKDIKSGIPYYHLALEAGLKAKDTIQIAYAYNNLGDAFYLIGNVPLAVEYGKQSLDYFSEISNKRGIAYSYINLGLAYRADRQFKKSITYFEQAIEIRKQLQDSIGIASATYEIALAYYEKNDLNKALNHFNKAFALNQQIDNKMYMAFALNGIGDVLFANGKFQEALSKYEKSLEYNEEGNHEASIIENKLGIALVYSKLGYHQEGEEQLHHAMELSQKLGFSTNVLRTYETYAKFYYNIGDLETSIKSYNDYLHIYDSLYSIQQFEALTEMQNRHQLSLNISKVQQDLETKKKETLLYLIIISLLLIIMIILIWRYRLNQRMRKKLSSINESKDKLFSIISHDLKAPFNSILGFSNLLLKEAKNIDNEKISKYVTYIYKVSNQSVSLIDNITDWSRAQRGVIKIFRSVFNVKELFKDVATIHLAVAEHKNIKIKIDIDPELTIKADQDMIKTIVRNLTSNAIKFTPDGGEIILSAQQKESNVIIKVMDTGVGIHEKDLKKLFKVKESYTTRGTDDEQGTGLGLIICNDFAKLHGGSIHVNSKPGKGSEFIVLIPL